MKKIPHILLWAVILLAVACKEHSRQGYNGEILDFGNYKLAKVKLNADLSHLSEGEKEAVLHLILATRYADSMFLYESAGQYSGLYKTLTDSLERLRFEINFGPWDRFNNNVPFVEGVGAKPAGANFYPVDMLPEEFNNFRDISKYSHYTFIRRDSNGALYTVPYHKQFEKWIEQVKHHLTLAALSSRDSSFIDYLMALSKALETDAYFYADSLWLGLTGDLDFVFGPVIISEDRLLNIKAEHQAYVLLKDYEWTGRIQLYTKWLRYLQKVLPVPEQYRKEEPGVKSKTFVYDVLYYGGSAHAGPILFSVTLPFDPKFQIDLGGKNLLFKNVIFAKYNAIIRPLADLVLVKSQAKYVNDTAFFVNTLFWEMADNLGIRNTVNGKGTVRQALREYYNVIQYVKNDLLVLFLAEKLSSVGEISTELKRYYYTFVVDLIRQIRWGSEDEEGLAALVIFNYLYRNDAIDFLPSGEILLHYDAMKKFVRKLITDVLLIQGNGDYRQAAQFVLRNKYISPDLHNLLEKISNSDIPVDIFIEQGVNQLKFN